MYSGWPVRSARSCVRLAIKIGSAVLFPSYTRIEKRPVGRQVLCEDGPVAF